MPAQGFGGKPRLWMGSSLSPPPVTLGESSPLPGPPGFFVQCRCTLLGTAQLGTAQRELEAVAVLAALVRDPPHPHPKGSAGWTVSAEGPAP